MQIGIPLSLSRFQNRSGGGGFVPPDSSNLRLWFKADGTVLNGSDAAAADMDQVKTWTDESGSGNTLSQSTSSKRPTFRTNIQNGLPGVYFDGIDDVLWKLSPANVLVNRQTYIYIASVATSGDIRYVSDAGFNPGVGRGWVNRRESGGNKIQAVCENIAVLAASTDVWTAASGTIIVGVYHGNGSPTVNAKIFVNAGDQTDSGNANASMASAGDFALGADSIDGTYSPFKGYIHEFLMWDKIIDEADFNQAFADLNAKWACYEA